MDRGSVPFRKPTAVERVFNRIFGFLIGLGIGFEHSYLLEVTGRKSGEVRSLPVDLLELDGRRYLVAPRGNTQWVRNARAAGEVVLRKGSDTRRYRVRPLDEAERPPVVKAYLDHFQREVQRFFPIPAGSPVEDFAPLAARYPAFELTSA